MIDKKCDVTGASMKPNDLDFGEGSNVLTIKNVDGESRGPIGLEVRVKRTGQFGGDLHISRDGLEKLLIEVADNLPTEKPVAQVPPGKEKPKAAKTTDATDKTPDGGDKTTPAADSTTAPKLTR